MGGGYALGFGSVWRDSGSEVWSRTEIEPVAESLSLRGQKAEVGEDGVCNFAG
jgi:hypothetical protein